MSLKPSNAGVYQINALNVNSLFIEGVPFQTFISELVAGDQLEQGEIDEIKQVLLYLNTSGLTTEWVVGNNNINAAIKTALDTLTGRVDGNDTSIGTINTNLGTLNTKTQYQTSVQGDDGAATNSTFQVSINDRIKRQMSLSTGTNSISSINNSSTQGSTGNYNQNRILLQAANGQVWSYAHLNTIEAIDKIEIGSAFGVGAETAVNIGARNNRINIGSIDAPDVGSSTTTEITIGRRSFTNNTTCNLQGNFYTGDARWESLTKSSALTWTQLLSLISTSGLPLWVASFALTSSIPNFSYSDLWSMKAVEEAGGLIKNGEVETTKGAKLKTLTVFDTEVGVDLVPKEGTFFAKGHISKTTLLGDIKMQTFNGEILLKANNISPSNINWALTEAMDNVNALKISNNDVELIAGSGADGSQLRISNTTGGPIKLRVGTGKLQANAHDALNVLNSQATSQVQIGNAATTANRYDATTKLIVDHTQLADGIKVCKDAGSVTRINHDNITTPSINVTTLVPTTITGWEVKSLTAGTGISLSSNLGVYTINSSGGGGGGGGTTFILTNATSVTNTSPTNTMTTTYTSTAQTTITRNAYTANVDYAMGEFKSEYILGSANLILQGTYTADLYGLLTSNQASYLYSKLYHIVERATPSTQFIVDKSLIYTTGSNTTDYQLLKTKPIPVPVADCSITLYKVVIPALNVIGSPTGAETITLTLRLVSNNNGTETTQYTFPVVVIEGANLGDITFQVSGGSTTIDMFTLQSFYFTLTLTDNFMTASVMRQALMRSNTDIVYKLAATTKTLIYNGTSNKTILTNGVSTLYQLNFPFAFNSYDISDYTDYSKIQFEPFFIQPSGSTNNHSFVLSFQDGALSHLHTSISSTGASTLAQVLSAGNTANTSINMNSNNITNVGTIAPTAITGWNVKSIAAAAGSGLSIANVSGAITINTTTSANDSDPGYLISAAAALPTKPFWYNTQYSWLYNASNVNTADSYYDSCVSNTGQYQLLVAVDRIRYSVDWGVTFGNTNFTTFSLRGCCITGSGNRYYLNGQYRVFYFDATYSTFASGGNYLTSFPTLSGGATYTKIACSQDGKHILVGVAGGTATIYKSNDYGFTSLQVDTQGVAGLSINDVAMSADGKYQFAMFSYYGSGVQGRVMYSTNYGVTWNSPTTMPDNGGSMVLNGITCSATGQYVLALRQSVGMLISSDYGKNYIYSSNAETIYPTGGCCMSANGQFQLVNAVDRIYYSEDYGRTFLTNSGSLLGSPSSPDLITIACSSTGGYAVAAGASGRSWVIYDVPTDVRQLVAGSNMTITPNGYGSYTLASTGASSASILAPHYTTTATLVSGGLTTITLPGTGVNLNDYDIDLRINMTFANSGTQNDYTFFGIQYNGYNNGNCSWTNHRHGNANFVNENPNNGYGSPVVGGTPGGFYIQSFLNPYFGFILSYDSASTIQFLSSNITINKTNYTSTQYAPIMTKFSTTVGSINSTTVTANDRLWTQNGMIQSGQNGGTGGFPEIRTISINQFSTQRDQYSGVPVQFVVWLKRRT